MQNKIAGSGGLLPEILKWTQAGHEDLLCVRKKGRFLLEKRKSHGGFGPNGENGRVWRERGRRERG